VLVEKVKTSADFYTGEKFDMFYEGVVRWAEAFGLTEWRIFVAPRHLEPGVAAQCSLNTNIMEATIDANMADFFPEESDDDDAVAEATALHQVLELLFASYVKKSSDDGRGYLADGGCYSLINRISSVILKLLAGVPVPPVPPVPPVKAGKK
jgi:hypothetical protein